jgi:hypothetical protein
MALMFSEDLINIRSASELFRPTTPGCLDQELDMLGAPRSSLITRYAASCSVGSHAEISCPDERKSFGL